MSLSYDRFTFLNPKTYEDETFHNKGGAFVSLIETTGICSQLDINRDSTILEVGVGPGRILRTLKQTEITYVGIDRDCGMIKYCIKSYNEKEGHVPENFNFVVADGQNLPFRENIFNAVICIRVLKYFVSPAKGVSELSFALKPAGQLIIEFSNFFSATAFWQLPLRLIKGEFYPRLFKLDEIKKLIQANDLTVKEMTAWHKVPTKIWNLVNSETLMRVLFLVEVVLQKLTPIGFVSKSIMVSAYKKTALPI